MIHLMIMMLERVGIIVILGFILAHTKLFRQALQQPASYKGKAVLITIFSLFSIISNYTGIEIQRNIILNNDWVFEIDPSSSIANTRIMGVEIGGLLGGPIVGAGVGLLAGLHRLSLGGSTAFSCAVSSILAGILAGWIGSYFRKRYRIPTPRAAALVGIGMEALQMLIILLMAKPFADAWALVSMIGIPMILINGSGSFIFLSIIQSIIRKEEQARALETHRVLMIADQTLPYFRQGLNENSCKSVAAIIHKLTGTDAVSLTDNKKILAHVGAGTDHHIPSKSLITGLSKKVIKTGYIMKATSQEEIECTHAQCPLHAAIVLPLTSNGKTIGTLKMYFKSPAGLSQVEEELAEGLAMLFSTQLELGEAELQSKLLKDAEIKALQAQVNPHFLFNAINTISALCRTDVEKTRKLLLQLSVYFRSNLQGARQLLIPLSKELNHLHAYLSLEQARFPGKYEIEIDIEDSLDQIEIPPFVLQVLVENALRHAFPKKQDRYKVEVQVLSAESSVYMKVKDNGRGIAEEIVTQLGNKPLPSKEGTGTALYNLNQRLVGLFGQQAALQITSGIDNGTEVSFQVPLKQMKEGEEHAEGVNR
ncbi:sensor histidine kinase [Bacillus atrophaeus]|uniref:histidine kinase n=1 Tax=Bacillus atrophaeus (strain 1942) TaxID=720555 RepID=A0ABN3ZC50_BACA1|nr:sensor histidine kinase [Bacillus atrophaeus]AMR61864.1 histidine kinase [Bacillus subtilis subsp. globigii]ADP33380.1 two-component sensor histidine kinase (LytT) [Bacillus atrophaeus 1942]AIK47318.1 GAF domain protein [Bacillus atrophaeus subsp. globigii]ASS72187.1 sensor histidine kinase [Bacillus atrophaeus]ATO28004.1 sensor histidine kinase [Bacillus atrophaeus]